MANVFAHSLLERSASQYRKKDQFLAALIIETLKLPDNTFDHVLSNNLTLSARGPSLRLGNIPDLSKYEYVWVNVWAEGDPPNGSRNAAKSGRGVVAGDEVSFDVGGLTPGSYYFGFFGYDKDGAETYLHFSQTALFKWDGSQLEIPGTATTDDRDRHLDELRAILTGQPMNSGIDSSLTANARAIPSGGNSVQTSVAISQQGWESASTVIIAPSAEKNLIDALAVAPLAGQEGAPVLLNSGDVLDPAVAEEIQRLGVRKIIAVGALTNEFIANVKTLLPDVEVELLRGVDRWHTANLINAKITNPNGVFIVGCKAAPDSVSAASWAAANGFVIQLAQPDGSLSPALSSFLSAIPSAYILGGPALVKNIPGVARLYGADRFQTNQAVLNALSYDHSIVYTVDGYALAEGIAGSVLAAKTKSPLVLIK
ncbi:MAG: cell wall-binding repeat-containing protein [Gracilibacteraceae bacterium]|nr:cell wall-binding repeat-containing protein [Gracilibacteraceae bacterium]